MTVQDLSQLENTEALGRAIARQLRPGDAVLLEGPLGAGKTTLARALLRQACQDPTMDVPSPTYTLVQSYAAPGMTIHHFDLWRLTGPDSLHELGWDDSQADVVVVEWPDRLGDQRPSHALTITIGADRRATLSGWADRPL